VGIVRLFAVAVLILATLALGQEWEFEQVDGLSPSQVGICRHPDGRFYIGYRVGAQFWLAWKDSVWEHESTDCPGLWDFSIGADGTIGIAYVTEDTVAHLHYAARTDSGWRHETLPWSSDGGEPCLGIGPDGRPGVLFADRDDSTYEYAVLLASRTQDSWRLDTVSTLPGTPGGLFAVHGLAYDTLGRACGLYRETRFDPSWVDYLYVFNYRGNHCLMSGYENLASGVLGLEPGGKWAVLFSNDDQLGVRLFYVDSEPGSQALLDSSAREVAVALDTAGRPQILYARGPDLCFGWRQGAAWRTLVVPRTGVMAAGLNISDSGQPVIAFSDAQGVWLARGVDVVGMEDSPKPQAPSCKPKPTILSGSMVRSLEPEVLFDAAGRRVRNPRSGVYFICEGAGRREQGGVRVRKVVVQR